MQKQKIFLERMVKKWKIFEYFVEKLPTISTRQKGEIENLEKYLNAIYQNTRTAIQSIEDILPKVSDGDFVEELSREEDEYNCLSKECENFAKAEKIEDIKDNNWIEKAKLWSAINMGTMMDKSSRNIAEMMLMGTFMGIITLIKDKDDHKNVSAELDEIAEKLYQFERKNIDRLLPFLTQN